MSVGIHDSMLLVDSQGRLRDYMGQQYIEKQRRREKEQQQHKQQQRQCLPTTPTSSTLTTTSSSTISTSSSVGTVVKDITSNDILLGRGKRFQNHFGNIQLNKLLESYYHEYSSIQRSDSKNFIQVKADIVYKIIKIIQNEYGGRFLKQHDRQQKSDDGDDELWVVVDDKIAKDKIAYGFRTITKMRRIDGNANNNEKTAMRYHNNQDNDAKRLKTTTSMM